MSDYNLYSFEVEETDVLHALRSGAAAGVSAMLYINGMYYSVKFNQEEIEKIREEEEKKHRFWED